jgi:hypothetical protein
MRQSEVLRKQYTFTCNRKVKKSNNNCTPFTVFSFFFHSSVPLFFSLFWREPPVLGWIWLRRDWPPSAHVTTQTYRACLDTTLNAGLKEKGQRRGAVGKNAISKGAYGVRHVLIYNVSQFITVMCMLATSGSTESIMIIRQHLGHWALELMEGFNRPPV